MSQKKNTTIEGENIWCLCSLQYGTFIFFCFLFLISRHSFIRDEALVNIIDTC